MKKVFVAIMGYGVVGSGVYSILHENRLDIMHREGVDIEVKRILVRNMETSSSKPGAPVELFTTDEKEVISDGDISVVVECIGGTDPARSYILDALNARKTVVTANKEVISKYWFELEAAAKKSGAGLYMEGTVGGGIPILRTISDSMQANNIMEVMGIINGTTNYILTKMSEEGLDFETVLKEAQELGYAEADPTADVDGFDAAYKLSILSSMAFHAHIPTDVIYREGIRNLTRTDFKNAKTLGYTIKLIAVGKKSGNKIEVRVHPTMIPNSHPLASVRGPFNAIYLKGHAVGDIMLYGRGAGKMPTASAVVSDIICGIAANGNHKYMTFQNVEGLSPEAELEKNFRCIYCVRITANDQPGTMTSISGCFAKYGVSLKEVLQLGDAEGGLAQITFLTHMAEELSIKAALDEIRALSCVDKVDSLIRAEL